MKTTTQPRFGLKSLTAVCLAAAVSLSGYAPMAGAHSNAGLWGISGLLAGTMLGRASARKHESQPRPTKTSVSTTPSPASAAPMTAEQKMQQLNALAAGGYITPQEYKTEKQAILNQLAE